MRPTRLLVSLFIGGTDPNCGAGTGGSGKKTGYNSWECVYDAYGYCDVACRSCVMV
ncbi:MAG TPA: hypothetical protein VF266_10805 [Thermoanaerobaculia bacterium]